MPNKKHRVTTKMFKTLINDGKRFNACCINILYLPAKKVGFSVVIPKKVARKAVCRNKLKRQLREITSDVVKKHNINNLYFVVFLKQNCKFGKFQDLKTQLNKDFNSFLTKVFHVS